MLISFYTTLSDREIFGLGWAGDFLGVTALESSLAGSRLYRLAELLVLGHWLSRGGGSRRGGSGGRGIRNGLDNIANAQLYRMCRVISSTNSSHLPPRGGRYGRGRSVSGAQVV